MSTREYRTPDGQYTTSVDKYLRHWRKIQRALEKKLGVRVYAFDPDFDVVSEDGKGLGRIPMWLARKITGIEKKP